jgi:hypothetical protein
VNASLRPTNVYPFGWNYEWMALGLLYLLDYDAVSLGDMLLEIGRGSGLLLSLISDVRSSYWAGMTQQHITIFLHVPAV